jgi:ABC-type Fe2+-enterobactin transport system substrate-binding protein
MKSSWTPQLECRWSDVAQQLKYNPPWLQEPTITEPANISPDYTIISPFGASSWWYQLTPQATTPS